WPSRTNNSVDPTRSVNTIVAVSVRIIEVSAEHDTQFAISADLSRIARRLNAPKSSRAKPQEFRHAFCLGCPKSHRGFSRISCDDCRPMVSVNVISAWCCFLLFSSAGGDFNGSGGFAGEVVSSDPARSADAQV